MFESIFIVAEAGMNHNGSLDTAVELVWRAREAGADAVKFQDLSVSSLFSVEHYTRTLGLPDDGWVKRISEFAFKPEWRKTIHEEARRAGIAFFSTPFSVDAVDALDPFVPFYKVASSDITFFPLLDKIASKKKGVFLSTGASTPEEIGRAVRRLRKGTLPFLCIMHCIMLYPAPPGALNLNFIGTLRKRYGLPVGFSDHTPGQEAALAAVGKGIQALEKHFTLDKNQEGPDHKNSLDPGEFAGLVRKIRLAEEMLGGTERGMSERERQERVFARRGIYAGQSLRRGERITLEKLRFLRPNISAGADQVDRLLGKKVLRDVEMGAPIDLSMVEIPRKKRGGNQ